MPHYKNGDPVMVGDIAQGKSVNDPCTYIGTVAKVLPGSDACNMMLSPALNVYDTEGRRVIVPTPNAGTIHATCKDYMKVMLVLLAFVLGLAATAAANPRGYGRSYGYSYYQPSYYQPACYPAQTYAATTYGQWSYWVYPATEYYYRVRYRYDGGARHLEDDGWLYSYAGGHYVKHCLIADFVKAAVALVPNSKLAQYGATQYGVTAEQYAVAKTYPKLAGILQAQGVPNPVDVASLLPPPSTYSVAIQEAVSKQATSASQLMAQVLTAEQVKERELNQARIQLAMQANTFQAMERFAGQFKELAAVAQQQATVSATANAAQIPIDDPALAQIIGTNCFQCHGGAKVEHGVDFRRAREFTPDDWRLITRQVIAGRMPKGGQPLTDEQVRLFEDYHDRIKAQAQTQAPPLK